jgi:formylglycine-generating enzyme required for sulfatase activity
MSPKVSSLPSVFEKVLRGFDTGGFTYSDVEAELKELLATGASPTELLEILQRRELIAPLPDYARAKVLDLLNEAIEAAPEPAAAAEAQDPPAEALVPDKEFSLDMDDVDGFSQKPVPPGEGAVHFSTRAPGSRLGSTPRVLAEFLRPAAVDLGSLAERARSMEARIERQDADYEELSRSYQQSKNAESASAARAASLAADLAAARSTLQSEQGKNRELNEALAARTASAEAVQLRSSESLRETERYQTEARMLRNSLAARDAQLAALQQEHAKIVPALEAQAKNGPQLEEDLRAARAHASALAADLSAALAALQSEQSKVREVEQALAERIELSEAADVRSEEAFLESERHQTDARALRGALAERDEQLAELQQEHSRMSAARDALAKSRAQLEIDLQAIRAQAASMASDLKASRDDAAALRAQLERGETHLHSARAELGAEKKQSSSFLELLRTREWRRGFDQSANRESDTVDKPAMTASADARPRELEPAQKAVQSAPAPAAPGEGAQIQEQKTTAAKKGSSRPPAAGRGRPGNRATISRAVGLLAGVLVLAMVAWFYSRRGTEPAPVLPAAPAPGPTAGSVIHDCDTCPGLTVLAGGRFKQGSAADGGSGSFDKPQHWVVIGRPLAMSTKTVTVDEFARFIAATGRDMQGCDTYDGEWKHRPANSWENPGFTQTGSHPVTCVSWVDAKAYVQWLSANTGHRYRLPSASEWEYAARAGSEAGQPWEPDGSRACVDANVADQSAARRYPGWAAFGCDDGYVYTAPVGSFKRNAFGLNDMLGNVFQWTEDCWTADYTGAPIDGSARLDGDCSEHELRGGSWFSTPAYVRASYRNHFAADYRTSSVGIRVIRDIDQ